ncbi:MAG TPA: hypothetical protein PL103_01860, partial [Saccharofermentans sp.]|nr:hypothetical protein [Saccharofermentans sp.]
YRKKIREIKKLREEIEEMQEKMNKKIEELEKLPEKILATYGDESTGKKKTMILLERLYEYGEEGMSDEIWRKNCEEIGLTIQASGVLLRWGYVDFTSVSKKRTISTRGIKKVEEIRFNEN